ncbi:peroxiredoxin [Sphaerisporangium rufum]|uniref:Alkyl hydroperoxide reductase E n=1 Tax=Sphaerisporangium rufum TaxID=1381558 RepID=A0A919R7W3_9ACTN|nr:peroxiredoxin [Sphaerisporangium rufum]GII79825.1 peroxiredoxin [Sphaerisporangium rufum]
MAVEVGDRAPDFELRDQHGAPVRLSDLRGGPVLLVFYPLAFSGVCQGELRDVRDGLAAPLPGGVRVLTVSVDSMFAQRAWADREGFDFPMLSDFWPHGEVARAYGVLDEDRGVAVRGTFVIDGEGVVRWKAVHPIPSARDIPEYRQVLAEIFQ